MYLILHKVRGEPAFDIADQLEGSGTESDPGPWWIIPTSGHRAYPYKSWPLEDLIDGSDINGAGFHDQPWTHDVVPAELPDHYYYCESGEAPKPSFNVMALVSAMLPKLHRRV